MSPLRIHYFRHVPFEDPGCILKWASQKGHKASITRFYESSALPLASDFDWLVVMGGPMGVDEERTFPWLREEKAFIKSAIDGNKTVIGICLGAQLIATSLGVRVYKAPRKEIGWFPVSLTPKAQQMSLFQGFPGSISTFHWHGDTFDLPENAIHLMESVACKNQAFLYKTNVLGLQFHLEATATTLTNMLDNCRTELIPAEFVQREDFILKNAARLSETHKRLTEILDRL